MTVAPSTDQRAAPGRWRRASLVALAVLVGIFAFGYSGISLVAASILVYAPPKPITQTPAQLGLSYRDVTFPSQTDHLALRGWFIPGVLPDGGLTARRVIIMVHGNGTNRSDPGVGLLDLSGDLALRGFAVLAFDLRGMGESPPAPLSLGEFEQRDVLGAVAYLRTGPLAYPALGRPVAIGGWGVSLGAATLLLAAAQTTDIRAIVSDAAYADIVPILEREIPKLGHTPTWLTPGVLVAARELYGIDYGADRPVDVVARIAPRPILFIHGGADNYIPLSNMVALAAAARAAPGAHVQTWVVPGADHAQSFHVAGVAYVDRVAAFFAANL